ncbi:hypothetical protein C2I36_14725 [Rhodobacteraceae bacterium WD3A24]|nr:hypothetical protein C2I36_14725 [Rhodobacteraceae bacterium WD3A24]
MDIVSVVTFRSECMSQTQQDISVGSEALRLLVAEGEAAALEAVQAVAEGAAPPITVVRCESVEAALALDGAAPVLVPVRAPLDHLQRALQAGAAPEAALDAWREGCEALLRVCRKARRRVVMVDAGMLASRPETVAEALGARLGVHLGPAETVQMGHGSEVSHVHAAIAATLLANDSRALELADEFEAMLLGPVTPRTLGRDGISAAAREAAALAEESDLLRENLQQMHADAERLLGEKTELEANLEALRQERDRASGELSEARQKLDAADAARAGLEARLEEQRASAEDASRKAAQEVSSLTEERDLLRENLQQMLGETERLLGEKTELEGRVESLNSELGDRHLLKAQLDAVGRQLEEAREVQRLRESVLGAEILQMAAQARQERAALAEERDRLTADLQAARDEIMRLRESTSWKVTAPLRAARQGLSRP